MVGRGHQREIMQYGGAGGMKVKGLPASIPYQRPHRFGARTGWTSSSTPQSDRAGSLGTSGRWIIGKVNRWSGEAPRESFGE